MSGKWGVLSPKWTKEIIKQHFNRGYSQPLITGQWVAWEQKTSRVSFYARKFDFDWLKVIAMRADAARTPLYILRRQIWMARAEYWFRKLQGSRALYRAAKVEWAYIKERLKQPFTWTGHDIGHGVFWLVQCMAGFVLGEMICRRDEFGYDLGVATDWTPARPQFAPGFFHVHGIFHDYPFEKHHSKVARNFQRGYWPNNDANYYVSNNGHAHATPFVPFY